MKDLEVLYEKYKFDSIYINPKELEYLEWEFIPEEVLTDFVGPAGYLGTIKISGNNIEVYYNKKITSGDVIFKYKDIKKERRIKFSNIIHNSGD